MIINTEIQQGYAVTPVSLPLSVWALDTEGRRIVLGTLDKPGQFALIAPTSRLELSGSDALVTPLLGRVVFSAPRSASGSGFVGERALELSVVPGRTYVITPVSLPLSAGVLLSDGSLAPVMTTSSEGQQLVAAVSGRLVLSQCDALVVPSDKAAMACDMSAGGSQSESRIEEGGL